MLVPEDCIEQLRRQLQLGECPLLSGEPGFARAHVLHRRQTAPTRGLRGASLSAAFSRSSARDRNSTDSSDFYGPPSPA